MSERNQIPKSIPNSKSIAHREQIYKILHDKVRLSIISYLWYYQEMSFQQIQRVTEKSKSTVHHHLKQLLGAGLVYEVERDEKPHGNMKYYALHSTFQDFSITPSELEYSDQEETILTLFEYGKFYFQFMQEVLGQAIKFSAKEIQNIRETSRANSTDVLHERRIDRIRNIIKDSRFIALPIDLDDYREITGEVAHFIKKFLNKKGKKKRTYSEQEKINWILLAGIPFGAL